MGISALLLPCLKIRRHKQVNNIIFIIYILPCVILPDDHSCLKVHLGLRIDIPLLVTPRDHILVLVLHFLGICIFRQGDVSGEDFNPQADLPLANCRRWMVQLSFFDWWILEAPEFAGEVSIFQVNFGFPDLFIST